MSPLLPLSGYTHCHWVQAEAAAQQERESVVADKLARPMQSKRRRGSGVRYTLVSADAVTTAAAPREKASCGPQVPTSFVHMDKGENILEGLSLFQGRLPYPHP